MMIIFLICCSLLLLLDCAILYYSVQEDLLITLIIFLIICSLLLLPGVILYYSVQSGKVPSWLKWWPPTTKRLLSYNIDERYSQREWIQIDGVVFFLFGVFFIMLFSLTYLLVVLDLIGKWGMAVTLLFGFAPSGKLVEFFSVMILKKKKILRSG